MRTPEQYQGTIDCLMRESEQQAEQLQAEITDHQATMAEIEQQSEQITDLLTQQQHTQAQRDRDLNTLNKTQCEVHKAANRANAFEAENKRLKEAMQDAINAQNVDDRSEILQRTLKAAQPQGGSE